MSNKDYETGYKKPPEGTRFTKGKSGNPKGRPKGSRNTYKLLEDILNQNVTITQDGRPVRISKKMAILLQAVNSAVKGDSKAFQTLFPHMTIIDAKNEEREKTNEISDQKDLAIIEAFVKRITHNE